MIPRVRRCESPRAPKSLVLTDLDQGHESSFFSLFALTNKSGAFIGPLLMSAILQSTGNFYYAFLGAATLYGLAIVIVIFGVDFENGAEQAKEYEL